MLDFLSLSISLGVLVYVYGEECELYEECAVCFGKPTQKIIKFKERKRERESPFSNYRSHLMNNENAVNDHVHSIAMVSVRTGILMKNEIILLAQETSASINFSYRSNENANIVIWSLAFSKTTKSLCVFCTRRTVRVCIRYKCVSVSFFEMKSSVLGCSASKRFSLITMNTNKNKWPKNIVFIRCAVSRGIRTLAWMKCEQNGNER